MLSGPLKPCPVTASVQTCGHQNGLHEGHAADGHHLLFYAICAHCWQTHGLCWPPEGSPLPALMRPPDIRLGTDPPEHLNCWKEAGMTRRRLLTASSSSTSPARPSSCTPHMSLRASSKIGSCTRGSVQSGSTGSHISVYYLLAASVRYALQCDMPV